ncbi:hypothetical protein CWB99_10795 [Pseudoalteromonas rubra]|uniref:Uncharacterized protein n=1 Tax=Pseudoalteromonas rubra TaxID=43658 RepID=A0A5S3WM30_9GAMM|nr:hypothetical protein [Pseudoalteromonas rubra]TMP28718.1 hypothetical protein CWB99_10795 [Pseudoalteromonas rubra]TMP28780.1 hypothetical protein CWC00_20645 [Pseudoalteromonas rubra]
MKLHNFFASSMLFLVFSGATSAQSIYSIGSDCTLDDTEKPITFRAEYTQRLSQNDLEVTQIVKEMLYEQLLSQSTKFPNGVQVDSLYFTSHAVVASRINKAIIQGALTVEPVVECRSHHLVSSAAKLNDRFLAQKSDGIDHQMSLQVLDSPKTVTVPETQITVNSVFGIELGTSYDQVEQLMGRFSLTWQFAADLRMAAIGRNHVLFFEQDKLIGYQYAKFLFPTSVHNLIEMHPLDFVIDVSGDAIQSPHKEFLNEHQLLQLEKMFPLVSASRVKLSDDETGIRLEALQIGRLPALPPQWSNPHCYDSGSIEQYIQQHKPDLVNIVSHQGYRIYMTGCSQIMTMNSLAQIKQLELLEPINIRNAELWQANTLFSMNPWLLGELYYNANAASLGEALETLEDGVVTIKNDVWFGHFFVEHDKVVAGSVIYKR